jgi:hypothetical protein
MAKDFLNVIERALMMGVSDTINTAVTGDVHVYGEFPETEDLKFPAIIVQHVGSGFEQQMMGQQMTLGGASGTGEIYGVAYTVHIILERDTEITIGGTVYKQRRLLNWLMLNLANAVMDINWDTYQEEELDVHERHLRQWRNIGFMKDLEWYGASADFMMTFSNFRS